MNSHHSKLTPEQRMSQIASKSLVMFEVYTDPKEMIHDLSSILESLRRMTDERDGLRADMRRIANARDVVTCDMSVALRKFELLLPRDLSALK